MNYYIYPDELYHYGRKGMKWGQNIFGKIRKGSFRKKRGRAEQEESDDTRSDGTSSRRQRKVSDMSDDEVIDAINRLSLEKRYKELLDQVEPPPKTVEKGQSFAQKFLKDTVKPAAAEAGKELLKKYINKKGEQLLGLDSKDGMEKLKKEAERMGYLEKISTAKNKIYNNNNNRRKNEQKLAEERLEEARKQVDEYNRQRTTESGRSSEPYRVSGKDVVDSKTETSTSGNRDAVIDAERWGITTVDDVRDTNQVKMGQNYIAGLLEDRHRG